MIIKPRIDASKWSNELGNGECPYQSVYIFDFREPKISAIACKIPDSVVELRIPVDVEDKILLTPLPTLIGKAAKHDISQQQTSDLFCLLASYVHRTSFAQIQDIKENALGITAHVIINVHSYQESSILNPLCIPHEKQILNFTEALTIATSFYELSKRASPSLFDSEMKRNIQ